MADLTKIPLEDNYSSTLSQELSSVGTTINVASAPSFTFPAGVTSYAVINPGKTTMEVVTITAVDTSANTITIGSRNQAQGASVTTTAQTHPVGSKIIISDNYTFWNDIKTAINSKIDQDADMAYTDETITGVVSNSVTTTERDALSTINGGVVYNETTGVMNFGEGGAWVANASGGSVADASETVAGKIELATNAEMGTATSTGGTGARLLPPNDQLVKTSSGAGDENKLAVLSADGTFATGFINSGASHITGEVKMWTTDTAPTGFLLCDGDAVSRTTYSDLFAVVSTTYGVGDGSTTFNLPDMRGRIPLGQDDMGGSSANRVTNAQADSLGGSEGGETSAHTHTAGSLVAEIGRITPGNATEKTYMNLTNTTFTADTETNANVDMDGSSSSAPKATTVSGTSASDSTNVMNPYLTLNYIIKT